MTWTLNENQAKLATDRWSAVFDLHRPTDGLQQITHGEAVLEELRPLQVTANPPVSQETIIDSYVRGADLVATYAQLPERTVRPQLQFRDLSDGPDKNVASCGLEMVVALQTSLLASDPTFTVASEVNSKEILALTRNEDWEPVDTGSERDIDAEQYCGAFVFRLSDRDVSYAELIFPADFQGARLVGGDTATFSYQLFPEFLEKGVIRKGRIWGLLMPRKDDLQAVSIAFQQMATAPPPLTV